MGFYKKMLKGDRATPSLILFNSVQRSWKCNNILCGRECTVPLPDRRTSLSSFLIPTTVGGDVPATYNLRSKWPTPSEKRRLRPISVYSASAVRASEKSSIIANRKSTTRFPTSYKVRTFKNKCPYILYWMKPATSNLASSYGLPRPIIKSH